MEREYNLVCGACGTAHTLTGSLGVMAAEIATFMAVHHEHGEFKINHATVAEEPAALPPDHGEPGDVGPTG